MSNWRKETIEMFDVGEEIFQQGIQRLIEYKNANFLQRPPDKQLIQKRVVVVEFVHGIELILKAMLIKEGYLIYKLKGKNIMKIPSSVHEVIDYERTVDLAEVVVFFRKKYPTLPINSLDELRKLRNEIVHRGTRIGKKKKQFFIDAIDSITGIYKDQGIQHRKFLKFINDNKKNI
jgi:hypothetical protein